MNHTLGDGHTYYKLYGMLNAGSEVNELDHVRVSGFEATKAEIIGQKETTMFVKSAGYGLGFVGSHLARKLGLRASPKARINEVDPTWVAKEKAGAKQESRVPFISANDALSSWFFREMGSDTNLMIVNFRNRRPSILGLADHHAGNYEAVLPYFPGDVETPALIRLSIRDSDGGFGQIARVRR